MCGAGDLLLLGSRGLSLGLVLLLICTPFLEQIREFVQRGDFTVWIVSANVAILLAAVLTVLSFDVDQILSHLWLIVTLLLGILLLDSVLLFFHQRRGQERKRMHMIEQYVPIVEELISQVRARQHEFNNRMLAIETAVSLADTLEEAQQEVAALAKGVSLTPNDRELLSCDSKIIAGMLFDKMKQAEAANLRIELQLHGLLRRRRFPKRNGSKPWGFCWTTPSRRRQRAVLFIFPAGKQAIIWNCWFPIRRQPCPIQNLWPCFARALRQNPARGIGASAYITSCA